MKKSIRKIHLWLGLLTGPIVFAIALTGAIYVFQEEIQNLTQSYRYSEIPTNERVMDPSKLLEIAIKANPNKDIHALMYHKSGKSAKAIFYSFKDAYYEFLYINPYSGKVLELHDVNNSFFGFILKGHFYLWLPPGIGQPVVAIATLLFTILLFSGLFLWWPRNKNNRSQRFKIRLKNVGWKRKNFDLHSVIGFYAIAFALLFSITGLVWGFKWFQKSYYFTFSGGKTYQEYSEPSSTIQPRLKDSLNMDSVFNSLLEEYPNHEGIEIHPPHDENSVIATSINPDEETYWKIDYRYFDRYSLKEKSVNHQWGRFKDLKGANKLMRMNYDLHTGAILGLPGKILAFLLSLLIASLPITGFLMWWGKKKNRSKKE